MPPFIKTQTKMNIPLIIKEVKKLLPKSTHEYSEYVKWKAYCTLSGVDEEGYFDLYFMETLSGEKTIKIARSTDHPMKYVDMIKGIDPEAVIIHRKTMRELLLSTETSPRFNGIIKLTKR